MPGLSCPERGGGVGHGYGFMRVNWPLEGPKVERVHRVALMVDWA